jgi:hypothetical protein
MTVVIIIGVLVAFLLPALVRAREQAKATMCQTQLRQIWQATLLYAHDYRDAFPGPTTTGNYGYRRAPGDRTPLDASSRPETYGLAAVLHGIRWDDDLSDLSKLGRGKYLYGRSQVWICPSADDYLREFNNTYAFNGTQTLLERNTYKPDGTLINLAWTTSQRRAKHADQVWVYDNTTMLPGLTGFRGNFTGPGYTVPSSRSPFMAHLGKGRKRYANNVYLDGHYERTFY